MPLTQYGLLTVINGLLIDRGEVEHGAGERAFVLVSRLKTTHAFFVKPERCRADLTRNLSALAERVVVSNRVDLARDRVDMVQVRARGTVKCTVALRPGMLGIHQQIGRNRIRLDKGPGVDTLDYAIHIIEAREHLHASVVVANSQVIRL